MSITVVEETALCPLCNANTDEPVLQGRDRLHGIGGLFHVVRCAGCGLMRTDPRPTPEAIGAFYPPTYQPYKDPIRTLEASAPTRSRWKNLLKALSDGKSQSVPKLEPGRLLEIGCSTGAFLEAMANKGWQVEGIEFSVEAGEAARRRGYKVQASTIEQAYPPQELCDLVVGWMVLEHLHQPLLALRKLRSWTKPGGWLALSIPDAGSLEFKIFRGSWYALQLPTHLYHYDRRTVKTLLNAAGWRVEKIFWHRNPANLFHSMKYVLEDLGWRRAASYLEDIAGGRRHRYLRMVLGLVLGISRNSGRMTVWARRIDS